MSLKRGPPFKYNHDEVVAAICARLIQGESLRHICKSAGMPVMSIVMKWLIESPHLAEQYARARELQADFLAEEILVIADDASNDYMEQLNAEGAIIGYVFNSADVQRSKLRMDARKWYASKLAPKKYGNVIFQERSKEKTAPVQQTGALKTNWTNIRAKICGK